MTVKALIIGQLTVGNNIEQCAMVCQVSTMTIIAVVASIILLLVDSVYLFLLVGKFFNFLKYPLNLSKESVLWPIL